MISSSCQTAGIHQPRGASQRPSEANAALPKQSAIALAACAVLATGPAWADCNGVASGTLTPSSGDTVTWSGTSAVSVSNRVSTGSPAVYSNSVSGVTVNNTGNLAPATTLTAIALGEGTQITKDGAIIQRKIAAEGRNGARPFPPFWQSGGHVVEVLNPPRPPTLRHLI